MEYSYSINNYKSVRQSKISVLLEKRKNLSNSAILHFATKRTTPTFRKSLWFNYLLLCWHGTLLAE